jgi:RIO-like serine/threonine protein kinase
MDKIIKELHGHSGSTVYLMNDGVKNYVLKKSNVDRNYERLLALQNIINLPELYSKENDIMTMQYIHGLDMENYLNFNSPNQLLDFISHTIEKFGLCGIDKDYTKVYNESLSWLEGNNELPFTKQELIEKLPKVLPESMYHGDMTLENIIYSTSGSFFFIDPVTVKYDSWVFDIAKLRQDLECKWFLRNSSNKLDVKLQNMQEKLLSKYPKANDDYLLILMLLRVYLHCEKGSFEHRFILKEVNRLWK